MSYKRTLKHDGLVEFKVPAVYREDIDPATGETTRVLVTEERSLGRKPLAKGSKFGGYVVGVPVTVTDEKHARALIAKNFRGADPKQQQLVDMDVKRWADEDRKILEAAAKVAAEQRAAEEKAASTAGAEEISADDTDTVPEIDAAEHEDETLAAEQG